MKRIGYQQTIPEYKTVLYKKFSIRVPLYRKNIVFASKANVIKNCKYRNKASLYEIYRNKASLYEIIFNSYCYF